MSADGNKGDPGGPRIVVDEVIDDLGHARWACIDGLSVDIHSKVLFWNERCLLPERIVSDHSRVFLSDELIIRGVRQLASQQHAQPRTPSDKAAAERFFRAIRSMLDPLKSDDDSLSACGHGGERLESETTSQTVVSALPPPGHGLDAHARAEPTTSNNTSAE